MSVSPNTSFSSLFPAPIPAAWFGSVLGLSGLGQTWRVASILWSLPGWIGEGILGIATCVWLWLLISYGLQAIRDPDHIKAEFIHPIQGGTPALLGISTLLIALASAPYSMPLTLLLAGLGIGWHLFFLSGIQDRFDSGDETRCRQHQPFIYLLPPEILSVQLYSVCSTNRPGDCCFLAQVYFPGWRRNH